MNLRKATQAFVQVVFDECAEQFKANPSASNWIELKACMYALQACSPRTLTDNEFGEAMNNVELRVGSIIEHLSNTVQRKAGMR